MENVNNENKKKPSKILPIIGWIFTSIFPFFKIQKINNLLKIAEKTYLPSNKDEPYPKEAVWFKRQRSKLLLFSLFPIFLISLSTLSSYYVLKSNVIVMAGINSATKQIKMFTIRSPLKAPTEAYKRIMIANRHPSVGSDIKIALTIFSVGILSSILFGHYIARKNNLIVESEKFKENLYSLSFLRKEDNEEMVLATPLGYLFRIAGGGSAREMVATDRLWLSLNSTVSEYVSHPDQRSIVFFKKAYPLRKGADYGYTTLAEAMPYIKQKK